MKKINPQTIIIIILILVIVFLIYNQWGGKIIAGLKYKFIKSGEKEKLAIGEVSAKLKIVEYYSYGCEYCKAFEEELKPQLIKNYVFGGKVRWVFRPLDPELGMAVLCANEQGRFSDFHDALFRNVGYIEKGEDLKALAKNLGLNENDFWKCYSSGKYETLVMGWYNNLMSDFSRYKIADEKRGTPAFLIGDEMITGLPSYNDFAAIIERQLLKK